jgi:hypothetical protein
MAAPYQPDLRDDSWLGSPGHESSRPHDPEATFAFNETIKAQERERARRSAEKLAKTVPLSRKRSDA